MSSPRPLPTYRGAVAILTGAGSGIGEALARALARRGAFVVVSDRRGDEAARVASLIAADGGEGLAAPLDVRDGAAVGALVDRVVAERGRLDYLFNNAGLGVAGEVKELHLDDWREIVEVNLMGVVHGVHAAYPRLVEQGFGHIVNTASVAGLLPSPMVTPYALTKSGVVGLSRALRLEAAAYGVRVTALCPGVIRTPILDGGAFGRMARRPANEVMAAAWEQARPMDPQRFAEAVLAALPKNPEILIIPSWWRLAVAIDRWLPGLFAWFSRRRFREHKRQFDRSPRRDPDPTSSP